jgi:hypothetical protein
VPDYEVPEPIRNSPYDEPAEHWNIEEGASPEKRPGRRPAGYFYRDPKAPPSDDEHAARGTTPSPGNRPRSSSYYRSDDAKPSKKTCFSLSTLLRKNWLRS